MDMPVFIINFLFVLLFALVLRWIRIIKKNTDKQVEQNQELITLLKEVRDGKVDET